MRKKPRVPAKHRAAIVRKSQLDPVLDAIRARTRTPAFERYLKNLLVALCQVNTTPNSNVGRMRAAEDACFRILEQALGGLALAGARLDRRPVNPAIATHPHYSLLHFTRSPRRPDGLSPKETYAGRSNLLCLLPGSGSSSRGQSVALNAHIDVVAPYFPPRVKGGLVLGRGACDDKGPAVGIVAALKIVSELLPRFGGALNRNVLAMFVIEEETGGNGSLSLAVDQELKKLYDSIIVCECTGLKVHPANRGAVWYRAELKQASPLPLLELAAFIVEELEREGAAIRAESRHPLFPQRPVQTCHGIIGPFGEHPSRICGEVSFDALFARAPGPETERLVRDCLEAGLAAYIGLYGDKTQVLDPATGKPVVLRHFDLRRTGHGFRVEVHGAAGHMGAIRERDGAITKMAHLVRSLVRSRARLEKTGGRVRLRLSGAPDPPTLILEGGQGFIPTHSIDEVMDRLRKAAERGAENLLRLNGRRERGNQIVSVEYGKLHNAAFDGDPRSPSMRCALATARACGIKDVEPVLGWTVSCDARLFAVEHPGMDVLTFGPGQLVHAHSDQEQISIGEIRAAAEFLALFLLRQTGTAG